MALDSAAARKRVLIAITIPLLMAGILNVELPTIARDLDTTSSDLVWINSSLQIRT